MMAQSASAGLTNGDFEIDFISNDAGWDYDGDVDHDEDGGNNFGIIFDGVNYGGEIWQEFYLPSNAVCLSFDFEMDTYDVDDNEQDYFYAFLIDDNDDPLVNNPGFDDFYYQTQNGYVENAGTKVGDTISIDLTGMGGQWVELIFALEGDGPIYDTAIYLDNVVVKTGNAPTVPAPGALLLGTIGVSSIGWLRRRRML